ncbi:MAG: sporulation protein [Sphingobacteriales bacterium]|nr:MAG: sporulation protein [Sphingobacteriales bacterium]
MSLYKLPTAFLLLAIAAGCAENEHTDTAVNKTDTLATVVPADNRDNLPAQQTATPDTVHKLKTYSNTRFRGVVAERIAPNKFRITGEGQIFEASFSWYVEDGHNELKSGFATTDAGAPEWGSFDFTIDSVTKQRPNSTLHLVLYETSAKDGSRQYELPIPLY